MGEFYKDPSHEGIECYNNAMKLWTTWTDTVTDVTIYPVSEFFRQKFNVDRKFQQYSTLKLKNVSNLLIYGRGFGTDDEHCRQSAMHSFFKNLTDVQLVPEEFLKCAQEDNVERNVELQATCINRWKLFNELLNQSQCKLIPNKPFNEKVTNEERMHVDAFWDAFKQNLHTFSRKRKLTVLPDFQTSNSKKSKPSIEVNTVHSDTHVIHVTEESPFPVKPLQNGQTKNEKDKDVSAIDLSTVSGDVDLSTAEIANTDFDDESELAPPEEEMTVTQVHAVDAIENEEIANFGAYPEYDIRQAEKSIEKLKKDASDIYEKTKDAILHHYNINLQNDSTLQWKDNARECLEAACKRVFPSARLFAVGSTMNGCGAYNSDMDVCVLIHPNELSLIQGNNQMVNALRELRKEIRRVYGINNDIQLIPATVPILKMEFREGLEVDLNINNIAGIYNTHLIHHYSRLDERFPALCLLIKHFALNAGINSAQDGTFNSYSLILLVLHYMQCACQPPILPNLQQVCPDIFNGQVAIEDLRFFEDEWTFESENHSDFTALLMGFFAYYAGFDFDKYAISIRRSRVFSKQILPQETRKKYAIFIEEPFDDSNTARSVRPDGYQKIKNALKEGNRIWNKEKRPSLEKIKVHLPKKYQ